MKILFLCTGNSCRSQMAEGWARLLGGAAIEAHSAGVEKRGLNPLAVRVMAESGRGYLQTQGEAGERAAGAAV